MPEGLVIVIRSTATFFSILILARVLGKRQISQLTFFDYVLGTTVGSISASISIDPALKFTPGWIGLLIWVFWGLVLSSIGLYNRKWRKVIDGEPTVVVQNGQILEANLKQLNYNVDDLRMQLRDKNVFSLGDVEFAVLEPNGKLSVLKKSQLQPVTPADLQISTVYKGLSVELIMDGQIVHENLRQLGLTTQWLREQVKNQGHAIEEVFYAELDTQGNLYVDLHDDLDLLPQEADISESGAGHT